MQSQSYISLFRLLKLEFLDEVKNHMKLCLKFSLILLTALLCTTAITGVTAQDSTITSVSSPTSQNLNSVYVVNNLTETNNDLTTLDAWAVGDAGTIAHWNGDSWVTVDSPTTENLYGVAFYNSSYGWAVGGASDRGVILNYDNGNWVEWDYVSFGSDPLATDMVNSTLYSVTIGNDLMSGWIVGADGIALSWSGDDCIWWGMPTGLPTTLRSVAMVHGSEDAWAVGDHGIIMHWTGGVWSNMTSPTDLNLYGIVMVNGASSAWAVGGDDDNGTILRLDGTTWMVWTRINLTGDNTNGNDIINATLNSVTMDTPQSAWAVGNMGYTLYWTGIEWAGQIDVADGADLKSVSMVHGQSTGSTQAWGVGDNGNILAWTGTQWVPEIPLIMVMPLLIGVALAIAFRKKLSFTFPWLKTFFLLFSS